MPFIPPAPANHRNSGVLIASTSLTVNIADLLNESWGTATKIGSVTVGSTYSTELKVGTTGLNGRHTLFVTNDSSKLLYIKNTTTLSSSDGILLNSGVACNIKLDSTLNKKIYAITFEGTAVVKVTEIKS
jgi:uncharacterized protein with beta-barrel porin domain